MINGRAAHLSCGRILKIAATAGQQAVEIGRTPAIIALAMEPFAGADNDVERTLMGEGLSDALTGLAQEFETRDMDHPG